MTSPKRIVVVDDDAYVRQLATHYLRPPEFECFSYGDPRDALMRLHDINPDLIVCDVMMPDMDGRTFFQVVKRSAQLKGVPFIFLSGVRTPEDIMATLEAGADDFLNKPFPLPRLVAKIRATLRMAERLSAPEPPRMEGLSGEVGPGGILPLLRFCEDCRLTGRITIHNGSRTHWADFLGGDLVLAGTHPEASNDQALDMLLSLEGGHYRIEQKPLDPEALRQMQDRASGDGTPPPPAGDSSSGAVEVRAPEGRFSTVDLKGASVQVQTEGENRPNFTVTTVIARDGVGVRKVETSWRHPLKRREDQDMAKRQIDRQHDRVVSTILELTVESPPRGAIWGAEGRGVDASLLAWALSFVAEQARTHLGAVIAVALLRRTHKRLIKERELLRFFKVSEEGRVVPYLADRSRVPQEAVEAMAAWTLAFLEEAGGMVDNAAGIRIRQVTRMMGDDLAAIGFYAALDSLSDGRDGAAAQGTVRWHGADDPGPTMAH
jgi:DNA-binding response OmpR family regulator